MDSATKPAQERRQAQQRVERFIHRFELSYRLLAYYAALPLVLTPELLNYLRNQFLRGEGVPWIAEVDLLLSDLCNPIGYEQYAMDTAVRAYLLEEMERELGKERKEAIARLLIGYVQQLDRMNPYLSQHELRSQQWAAMVYLDDLRETVVRQIAVAYQKCVGSGEGGRSLPGLNQAEMAQLTQITKVLEPQLRDYDILLAYAAEVSRILADPAQVSGEVLGRSFRVLENVELRLPTELLPEDHPAKLRFTSTLMTFEFEVATIAVVSDSATLQGIHLQPFEIDVATIAVREATFNADIALKLIEQVATPPGRQLDEIYLAVLREAIDGKTYREMAALLEYDDAYLKRVAAQLWRFLSDVFGEKITKTNLLTVLKRWNFRRNSIHHDGRQAWQFIENLRNGIVLEMVEIPEGNFIMGSPEDESERSSSEGPQHEVTIQPFFLGKYPVTQAQWKAVAALPQANRELAPDPSYFKGSNRPVEQISWYDAVEFCDRLSRFTGKPYRLPSEAEWEYGCRSGTTTPFHFGETITTDLANYNGNYTYGPEPKGIYRGETNPVGSFKITNAFGLYDMHGNVWEWCLDHWHDNYEGAPTDGSAWLTQNKNSYRLLRGGSWSYVPRYCRSAFRSYYDLDVRNYYFGFRVVCSAARTP